MAIHLQSALTHLSTQPVFSEHVRLGDEKIMKIKMKFHWGTCPFSHRCHTKMATHFRVSYPDGYPLNPKRIAAGSGHPRYFSCSGTVWLPLHPMLTVLLQMLW